MPDYLFRGTAGSYLEESSVKYLTFGRALFCKALAIGACLASAADAAIVNVNVQVENLSPTGGVAFTPVWVGFHSGNFDTYNSGAAAGRVATGLERLAEDGDVSVLSADFLAGQTYVNNSGVNGAVASNGSTTGRVSGAIGSPSGPPPLQPGQSATAMFALDDGGANNFFSYASMILPSNDFFIGNGAPQSIDLSNILANGGSVSFLVGAPGTVNDAGTEAEDFNFTPANGLFGLSGGQTGPNQGADDPSAFVRSVNGNPFDGFANIPNGADLTNFNFNDASLYTGGGIGRITITAVPEPGSLALLLAGSSMFVLRRRRS
ncbi:MAG: hypothetical protein Aurels2KO_07280 [Aureliella sp.]